MQILTFQEHRHVPIKAYLPFAMATLIEIFNLKSSNFVTYSLFLNYPNDVIEIYPSFCSKKTLEIIS